MDAMPLWDERTCAVCGSPLPAGRTGRPSRYCSSACRQRAYRGRRQGVTKLDGAERSTPAPARTPAEREVPHLSVPELLAWRGLLEVQSRMLPMLDDGLQRQAGLTINEFDLLYQLWIAPGQRRRMKHLAGAVLVTPSGVTRMVTRLEERGLVRRFNSSGRQAVEAGLTESGARQLHQAMDVHFADVRRLFVDNLSDTDIARLGALWRRLRRVLPAPTEH